MTAKRERVKFARFLRRKVRLTLPESVKVAKFYLGTPEERPKPECVVETYECRCGEGCCYGSVYRLPLKSGVMASLAYLYEEFAGRI